MIANSENQHLAGMEDEISSLQASVELVLDQKVRPALSKHGGNIVIEALEKAGDRYQLKVRMTGNCSGCVSADETMENLVSTEVTDAFPQIREVVLVTGVSDELIAQAKAFLKMRHS